MRNLRNTLNRRFRALPGKNEDGGFVPDSRDCVNATDSSAVGEGRASVFFNRRIFRAGVQPLNSLRYLQTPKSNPGGIFKIHVFCLQVDKYKRSVL